MTSNYVTIREAIDRASHFVEQKDGHLPEKRSMPPSLMYNYLLSARAIVLRRSAQRRDAEGSRRALYRDLTPIPLVSKDAVVKGSLPAPLSGIEFMVSKPIPRTLNGILDGVTDLSGTKYYEYIPFENISGIKDDRHPIDCLGYYTLRAVEPEAIASGGGTARASIWVLTLPGQPCPKAVRSRATFYDEIEVEEFLRGKANVCNKLDLAYPVDGEDMEEVLAVVHNAIRSGKQLSPPGVDLEDDEQNGAHSQPYRPWHLK